MGQQYHCHHKCYTFGAAVSVMSSGKPHQSLDLPTWSCGPVAQPQPHASCLGLCTTAHVSEALDAAVLNFLQRNAVNGDVEGRLD